MVQIGLGLNTSLYPGIDRHGIMKNIIKTKEQLLSELQQAQSELQKAQRQLNRLKGTVEKLKQIGAAENKSEDKFYKAFMSSPDMMIITSIPSDKYIEVNDSFARNVGYRREDLIGHTVEEYNFFANPVEVQRMVLLLQKQGAFKNEEFSFRVRSGEIQRWLCSSEAVVFNGENCLISVATDITKSKQMEQALNESQQILTIASNLSPHGIGITAVKDGRFIEVNESQVRLSGYTREEIIGHTARELRFWDNPEDRKKLIRKISAKERITNEKIIFRNKSGEKHKVLFSAEPVNIRGEECMISSSTDITSIEDMEQALQVSEDKFTRAFSSSPAAMCIFSADDSKFTEVNDSFTRFTGYTREEVIGRTAADLNIFVLQEEKDEMSKSLEETGTMVNVRIQSRMKSGEIRTGLFSAQSFYISDKKHMILTINDITDQVKAQEAIANEATLRHILIHGSKDGIVILDSNGKVYESNRRFAEMLGYSAVEMTRLYVWDWEYKTTRERLLEMLSTVDQSGDHFETQHRRKDGSIYDVEISTNGAIIAGKKLIFCVCRDITQRNQMEQALRESEEKFSKAFLASPQIIAITSLDNGKYIDINDNYIRAIGYSREELMGRTAQSLNIWAKTSDRQEMYRSLKEKGRILEKEYQFRTKSGEVRTWLFSGEPIVISGEKCLMGVAMDITERKLIEAQALEAGNLRKVDSLRRELLANVSHELRTPLAGIKGFTTMLMDYGKRLKSDEKREYLETINYNADLLAALIEQLIEMSRLGAGMLTIDKEPTDVIDLCQIVINGARARSATHNFTLDIPGKLPLIDIDGKRIHQVLDNLLDNAVKYSSSGTEVNLSVVVNDGNLMFTITDHGFGISPEESPHVFDRLFSSQNKIKYGIRGAGLGLPICKGLIEAHGGKIWFESKYGVGTSFFFTLPVKSQKEPISENSAG
jgi:PAS domain S-box-containing protein